MAKKFRLISAVVLIAILTALMIPALTLQTQAQELGFTGKKLSILGDSISTYVNVSQGTAAQTTNSTIGSNALFYSAGKYNVYQADTWWQQTADRLGMEVLVNNSWSGSCILNPRSYGAGSTGYSDRSINLHDDTGDNAGTDPDIIAIFLGTNDFSDNMTTLGTADAIDYDSLITETEDSYTYNTPANAAEAYAIMLYRITERYPNAEVYCLSLLPRVNASTSTTNYTVQFGQTVASIAAHYGAYFVDLYHDSGITSDSTNFYNYMGDTLHPNPLGMDAMTNCVVSAMLKNSRYSTVKDSLCTVTYDAPSVTATSGTVKTAIKGQPFSVSFAEKTGYELDVKVTMGTADVTATAFSGNTVSIAEVTGDIKITASHVLEVREPADFRWEFSDGELVSVTDADNAENVLTRLQGSCTNGVFKNTRYSIGTSVQLLHNLPWSVEWKSTGNWYDITDGGLLFAGATASNTKNTPYLYRRSNSDFIALGYYDGSSYHNYGTPLKANGIDATVEHVYRMTNRINPDGSNMIYLYVDNVEIGPMNHYYVGGTDKNTTVDWVSGQDFLFRYMGTTNHPIGSCTIEYIQVWEAGTLLYADEAAVLGSDGSIASCQSLEDALLLAKSGDTVQLQKDCKAGTLVVGKGITLDLNGNTLTAEYAVAVGTGTIVDNSDSNEGLLKAARDALILSADNPQLPVWNGSDGYLFSRYVIYDELQKQADGTYLYKFTVFFEPAVRPCLADGADDNALKIVARLCWVTDDGEASMDLTYNNDMVGKVVQDTSLAYTLTISDVEKYKELTVAATVLTDSGAEAAAEAEPVA